MKKKTHRKCKPVCLEELINKYYGKLENSSISAALKGPCGDEMEVFLNIENNKIIDIKVFTNGCMFTRTCGVVMASLADKKTIYEAMDISARDVLCNNSNIPADHIHCNILAVSTLYRAIALFLLNNEHGQ